MKKGKEWYLENSKIKNWVVFFSHLNFFEGSEEGIKRETDL